MAAVLIDVALTTTAATAAAPVGDSGSGCPEFFGVWAVFMDPGSVAAREHRRCRCGRADDIVSFGSHDNGEVRVAVETDADVDLAAALHEPRAILLRGAQGVTGKP
jgi:hypothetical protein